MASAAVVAIAAAITASCAAAGAVTLDQRNLFSTAGTNSAFREREIGIDHCIFEKSFLRVDFLHFEDFLVDRVAAFSVCSPFYFTSRFCFLLGQRFLMHDYSFSLPFFLFLLSSFYFSS